MEHGRRTALRLIFPRFQLMLLGANLGVNLIVSAIMWLQMRRALSDLKPVAGLSGFQIEYYKRYLDYQTSLFQTSLFFSMFSGLVVAAVLTLIVSHRFAGPMIRLRNYFRGIIENGKPTGPLTFRDGDYLGDLPPLINQAIEVMTESSPESRNGRKAGSF